MTHCVCYAQSVFNTPLAYFISFRTYGTWLHGDSRGSFSRRESGYPAEPLPTNAARSGWERAQMKQTRVLLEAARRVRTVATNALASVYADAFAITDPFHRRAVCDRLARLTLMLFDGVFVASQIEPDATDLRRAFETIAIAVKATGEQLMAQTARETPTDGMKGERR